MHRWKLMCVAGLAMVTLGTACGSCGGGNNGGVGMDGGIDSGPDAGPEVVCEDGLSDTVASAPWMASSTDVGSYRYRGSLSENELLVELLDAEGAANGSMTVRQILVDDAEFPYGTMVAELERADRNTATLYARGEFTDQGYFVRTTVRSSGQDVDVLASFRYTACPPPESGENPACALPVEMAGTPEYTVGSCGLAWLNARESGLFPRLDALRYEIDGAASSSVPDVGGVRRSGDETTYVFDVLRNTAVADPSDVADWLSQTGADALIGTDSVRLLTLAYVDPAWRTAFEDHAAECRARELIDPAGPGALSGCNAMPSALETRRQAAGETCNAAPARDISRWGESSQDNGEQGCDTGCSKGDPHMVSLDGHAFDFQGAGEYILAQATTGAAFEVQVRMEPLPEPPLEFCKDVSANTAIAFEIGERRIGIYSRRDQPLWIDGSPVTIGPDLPIDLPEGSEYELTNKRLRFGWPTGESVTYELGAYGDIEVELPAQRAGEIRGLLGTFTGSTDDEFAPRFEDPLPSPVSFEDLYQTFGESWRIAGFESLFDYDDGQGTGDFTVDGFPGGPVDASSIPDGDRRDAEATCSQRDIVDPWLFDACLIDVVCSAEPDAGSSAAGLNPPEQTSSFDEVSFTVDGAVRAWTRTALPSPDVVDSATSCGDDVASLVWLIDEREVIELSSDVAVDASAPGAYTTDADLAGSTVAAGEMVWSYALYFDRGGVPAPVPTTGSVTFSEPIVGVIVEGDNLSASDGSLGRPGANYPADRTVELGEDSFEISDDRRTIAVTMSGATTIDQLRVLVAPRENP